VWQYINPQYEPVATSVSKYLAETERLYRVSDSKGRSPFIYPHTHPLTTQAEKHGRECIVAALLYLQHRHGEVKLKKDPLLRQEYLELAYRVAGTLLESSDETDKQFGRNVAEVAGKLRVDAGDVIDEVASIVQKVKVFRQLGQFEEALEALRPIIIALEGELEFHKRKADLQPFEIERRNRIAAELSNCYGVRGGLLRRTGALEDSLSSYRTGCEIEQDSRYGISNSYNLVNELVLQILTKPTSIDSLQPKILDAVSIVSKQVTGDRHDQWWAWADLGMLNILALRIPDAELAYKRYWATGARDADFTSSRSTLEQIRDALEVSGPNIHDAIDAMLPKIVQMKPS
jgi:tetratricopeptide (TPR) repeat protein